MQARAISTFGFATTRGTSHVRYRGLKNLGNTCFLNAVLQSLTSIRSFHVYLAANQGKELNRALRDSIAELCLAKQTSVDPTPITKIPPLSKYFGTREQQDAQELMQYLFASLQEDPDTSNSPSLATIYSLDQRDPLVFMKVFVGGNEPPFPMSLFKPQLRPPLRALPPSHSAPSAASSATASPITSSPASSPSTSTSSSLSSSTSSSSSSLNYVTPLPVSSSCPGLSFPQSKRIKRNPFAGLLASSLRCNHCQKSSVQFNKFHDLSLSIPEYFTTKRKAYTLDECLKYFSDPESINDVLCGRCNTIAQAEKKLMVARQPRALCLHIRRLVVSRDLRLVKLNSFVEFPSLLDISPYCSFSTLSEDSEVEEDMSMSSSAIFGNVKAKSSREDASWSLSGLGGLPGGFSTGLGSSLLRPHGLSGTASTSLRSLLYTVDERMSQPSALSSTPSSSSLYDLKAVIVHEGSALGGHFSAYRKLRARPAFKDRDEYLHQVREVVEKEAKGECVDDAEDEEGWVHISDEKCIPVEESAVFNAQVIVSFPFLKNKEAELTKYD
eukprot:TRINITY_DN416_c0_g2_i1.p1 TRINITY_DN416_c0_g2~~TRINITY_DN416_c0_g2_i1.p1  ORF type:complete len:555 (+),score=65.28 TRINITY_DN416_c0_g2_i1:238-1902(+)